MEPGRGLRDIGWSVGRSRPVRSSGALRLDRGAARHPLSPHPRLVRIGARLEGGVRHPLGHLSDRAQHVDRRARDRARLCADGTGHGCLPRSDPVPGAGAFGASRHRRGASPRHRAHHHRCGSERDAGGNGRSRILDLLPQVSLQHGAGLSRDLARFVDRGIVERAIARAREAVCAASGRGIPEHLLKIGARGREMNALLRRLTCPT